MSHLPSILIYGLLLGGVYAVMAFGLSLIYGVMRVVNLAHGAVLMLAAYCAYALHAQWRIDPLLSLALIVPGGYLCGLLLYKLTLQRIRSDTPLAAMLLLFGVSLCLRNLAYLIWTGDDRAVSVSYSLETIHVGVDVPLTRVVVFAASLAATGVMFALLRYSHFGRALRAVTQDPIAAELSGLNVQRVRARAFGAGTALGALGGALLSMLYVINPELGAPFLLKSFCITVLGGMESMPGIWAGAMLLGLAETATGILGRLALQDAVSFVLLVVMLILLPGGLPALLPKIVRLGEFLRRRRKELHTGP